MRRQLVPALRMVAVLTVLLGLLYPLALTGVAQTLFKGKANGSQVTDRSGAVVGSALLGQTFTENKYFWGRPSAAGNAASGSKNDQGQAADPADLTAVNSGGSNLGPTNPTLLSTVQQRVDAYRQANGLAADATVPVDAVTASGSGVDPQISVANARLQAVRVGKARGITTDQVNALIDAHTTGPALGFLGEQGVNVLELNLALDGVT
jgi:potassium-transporting ATPase KdpC subunit